MAWLERIYALRVEGVIVYVGKTRQSLKLRHAQHRLRPGLESSEIEELETVTANETNARERYWINHFQQQGELLNIHLRSKKLVEKKPKELKIRKRKPLSKRILKMNNDRKLHQT